MNKSKIVLLTILIVLVLYCGGVIFLTKPNSNALEGLFSSTDKAAAAPASEVASVDSDAILAQAEKIAAEKADAARKSSEEYADAAIADAIAKIVIPEAGETVVQQGDTIIQKEEFDLDAHMQEIVDAVLAKLPVPDNDELAADLYEKYKDQLVDSVVDEIIARYGNSEQAPASGDDYDTIRRQMREEEIKKVLDQLHE